MEIHLLKIIFDSVIKWFVFFKINLKWMLNDSKYNLNVKIGEMSMNY